MFEFKHKWGTALSGCLLFNLVSAPLIAKENCFKAPDSVYDVAKLAAKEKLGMKVRSFDEAIFSPIIDEFVIMGWDSGSLRGSIYGLLDSLLVTRSFWLVPLSVNGALKGFLEVRLDRAPGTYRCSNTFMLDSAFGSDAVYFSEILRAWPLKKGFHPVIIRTFQLLILHVPERGADNLTCVYRSDARRWRDYSGFGISYLDSSSAAWNLSTVEEFHRFSVIHQKEIDAASPYRRLFSFEETIKQLRKTAYYKRNYGPPPAESTKTLPPR